MSSSEKIKSEMIKNGTLLHSDLIQCIGGSYNINFYSLMRNGYIEMGKINLQLASDNEDELVEINNYETWLCGV